MLFKNYRRLFLSSFKFSTNSNPSFLLFVDKIPINTTELEFREEIEKHGDIGNIDFPLTPDNNLSKGHAKIKFNNMKEMEDFLTKVRTEKLFGSYLKAKKVKIFNPEKPKMEDIQTDENHFYKKADIRTPVKKQEGPRVEKASIKNYSNVKEKLGSRISLKEMPITSEENLRKQKINQLIEHHMKNNPNIFWKNSSLFI